LYAGLLTRFENKTRLRLASIYNLATSKRYQLGMAFFCCGNTHFPIFPSSIIPILENNLHIWLVKLPFIVSDIFIAYDGIEYTYRVSKTYEVKPNELWVLRQDYSQKTLKVVTCVPPGTTLRRLIVEAQLIRN